MEIANKILLWLHFVGLIAGAGGFVGLALLGLPKADATLPFRGVLNRMARGGLAISILTGVYLLIVKWGGHVPSQAWFGVKMLLVVLLVVAAIAAGVLASAASAAIKARANGRCGSR
jgi:hypothetical protein